MSQSSSNNKWMEFPKDNTIYQLDVTFKDESINSENELDKYKVIHYAAYYNNNEWVDANSFDHINMAGSFQISFKEWY